MPIARRSQRHPYPCHTTAVLLGLRYAFRWTVADSLPDSLHRV